MPYFPVHFITVYRSYYPVNFVAMRVAVIISCGAARDDKDGIMMARISWMSIVKGFVSKQSPNICAKWQGADLKTMVYHRLKSILVIIILVGNISLSFYSSCICGPVKHYRSYRHCGRGSPNWGSMTILIREIHQIRHYKYLQLCLYTHLNASQYGIFFSFTLFSCLK